MNKKTKNIIKIIIVIALIVLGAWFLVLKPLVTFNQYEKQLEDAAKRYYELNQSALPTGSRIATVDMQTLYHKAYLKEDLYIPFTNEPCSLKESWVKVKKVNGEYKYYTYLKCGILESKVDNKGPEIKLNGEDTITINLGEEYKELGVKSVKDNTDGKMKTSEVTIKSSDVDTSKVGTYKVTYTALDSFKNKTTVTRTVEVISKLKNAVENATGEKGYYIGANPSNYVRLSGMLFRIIGVEDDNVKVVAEADVANVNFSGISSWLDYYYEHINEEAKKLLVKNKYCNMKATDETINTTECTSYTKERYVYIPSITDINKSLDENQESFLKPGTMSWTSSAKDDTTAYTTRNMFFGESAGQNFYADSKTYNYGVRPVLTIKGDTLIVSGDGTKDDPYSFGETKSAKADTKINTRYSGEYISYGGITWRIVEVNDDGTTKIISWQNIQKDGEFVKIRDEDLSTNKKIYNPKNKNNIGYYINNRVSEFIDTSYFVNRNVEVPIHKTDIQYGKEVETKKYKVKLSAPNMYEMFSAQATGTQNMRSYWLINSSKKAYYKGAITDVGVVLAEEVSNFDKFGVRVVGNLSEKVTITKGKGTEESPYQITK